MTEATPVHVLRQSTKNLKCALTDDEWKAHAMRHADVEQEMRDLEAQKKRVMSDLKSREKALDSELSAIGHKVRTHSEYRDVPCQDEADYDRGVVITRRLDTGDSIAERVMLDSERQLQLVSGEQPEEDEQAAATFNPV